MAIEARSSAPGSKARANRERAGATAGEGWTPSPARDSLGDVPRDTPENAPPVTPLEYLRFEPLRAQSASAKLVWLYIAENGPGLYTVREINHHLGVNIATAHGALRALREAGLIEGVTGSGSSPSQLRALKPDVPSSKPGQARA